MKQKVALVTGGSRGIGAAICKKLASDGLSVVVNYFSNKESADQVVKEIIEKGGKAIALQGDVTDVQSMKNLVKVATENLGPIDVFVSNAHIEFPIKPFHLMDWQEFQGKLNNELYTAFNTTKLLVESMMARKYGKIIFISSSLSKNIIPGFSAHGTAKGALNVFTQYLSKELGPEGITVNAVGPGFTETDTTKNTPAEFKAHYIQTTPLRKIANTDDIANGVSFLASDHASHVTGIYLPITGGI